MAWLNISVSLFNHRNVSSFFLKIKFFRRKHLWFCSKHQVFKFLNKEKRNYNVSRLQQPLFLCRYHDLYLPRLTMYITYLQMHRETLINWKFDRFHCICGSLWVQPMNMGVLPCISVSFDFSNVLQCPLCKSVPFLVGS